MISTPLAGGNEANATLSNGGIVAGRNGVAVIEGFASERGADWLIDHALEVTGESPTHVVLSHYHGDHVAGLAAYRKRRPDVQYFTTDATRDALSQPEVTEALADAQLLENGQDVRLDLGGRTVRIDARFGHTASDLAISVEDPHVVFCGDLVWNELFPNYMDSTPSVLSQQVRDLLRERDRATFIPGHGSVPTVGELGNYVGLLDDVEAAARDAFTSGTAAEVAAAEYSPSPSVGEWIEFSEAFIPRAFAAWYRELSGE